MASDDELDSKWAALPHDGKPWCTSDDFLHLLQHQDFNYPKYFIVRFDCISAEQDQLQLFYRVVSQRLELALAQKISLLCTELRAKEVTVAEASRLFEYASQRVIDVRS